jgi:hypothetical protein
MGSGKARAVDEVSEALCAHRRGGNDAAAAAAAINSHDAIADRLSQRAWDHLGCDFRMMVNLSTECCHGRMAE